MHHLRLEGVGSLSPSSRSIVLGDLYFERLGVSRSEPTDIGPRFEDGLFGATLEQHKDGSKLISATETTTWIEFAAA